jgi:Ribonuclease G/E
MARIKKMESGGKSSLGMKSVKAGFDKNPGVTRADIIVAAKKEAKGGVKLKKSQAGSKVALRTAQLKRIGRLSAKNPDKAEQVGSKMVERATRRQRGKEYIQKNLSTLMPKSKGGSKLRKARGGATLSPSKSSTSNRLASYGRPLGKNLSGSLKKAMGGMKMGKCKYGC